MAEPARPRNPRLLTDEQLLERRSELLAGVHQYNDGYFFEAHETLEDLWYVCPLPARTFLQGVIQLAAAFVHLARREYPGTIRLLAASIAKLEQFSPEFLGIDVERLLAEARSAREELIALGPQRFESWDRSRVPTIHLIDA
jgi:predicted metal-dependent hydrolase